MKKLLVPVALFAATALFQSFNADHSGFESEPPPSSVAHRSDSSLARAFESQADGVPVEGQGDVIKILTDDNAGSRHQRFLVRLASGQTVLIAHNIDLAERVAPLAVGDEVSFSGEYAWNPKGGVVHWTHRDPRGAHTAGWIRHEGHVFQ